MSGFLNTGALESLLVVIEEVKGDFVNVNKRVLRAITFELLQFIKTQDMTDAKKVLFIQQMTMEYAARHLADQFRDLLETDVDDMRAEDVVNYAIDNLEKMAKESELHTEGKS